MSPALAVIYAIIRTETGRKSLLCIMIKCSCIGHRRYNYAKMWYKQFASGWVKIAFKKRNKSHAPLIAICNNLMYRYFDISCYFWCHKQFEKMLNSCFLGDVHCV